MSLLCCSVNSEWGDLTWPRDGWRWQRDHVRPVSIWFFRTRSLHLPCKSKICIFCVLRKREGRCFVDLQTMFSSMSLSAGPHRHDECCCILLQPLRQSQTYKSNTLLYRKWRMSKGLYLLMFVLTISRSVFSKAVLLIMLYNLELTPRMAWFTQSIFWMQILSGNLTLVCKLAKTDESASPTTHFMMTLCSSRRWRAPPTIISDSIDWADLSLRIGKRRLSKQFCLSENKYFHTNFWNNHEDLGYLRLVSFHIRHKFWPWRLRRWPCLFSPL